MMNINGFTEIISKEEIAATVKRVGAEIRDYYQDKEFTAVCILKGAVPFYADLTRELSNSKLIMDFIRVSSYGNELQSSGVIKIILDLNYDLNGKNILLIDDVFDTGLTLKHLQQEYKRRGANVKLCVFIDKGQSSVEPEFHPHFVGIKRNTKFIVGYGLDYQECYRNIPSIYEKNQ